MTYDINTMTAQEVFDASGCHLIRQGAQSVTPLTCAYRGPEGRMCAAGIFIPDDVYAKHADPDSEFGNALEAQSWSVLAKQLGLSAHTELVQELQVVHDDAEEPDPDDFVRYVVQQLRYMAARHKFNTAAIEAALDERNANAARND